MEALYKEPPKRFVKGKHDWQEVVERLRANPGRWILADVNVSTSTVWRAGKGGIAALNRLGGSVESRHRDTHMEDGARGTSRYGDMWLRWTPDGWTEEDQVVNALEEHTN